jgi:hypothetical protein
MAEIRSLDTSAAAETPIADDERDFVLLTVYVLAQHGYVEKATELIEGLHAAGDSTGHVLLARAVLRFFARDFRAALGCLEELDKVDPVERFGHYRLNDRQRMRRYIKARCLFELREIPRIKDAVESYLRHGSSDI